MPKIITEDMIEQAAINALQSRHGYGVLNCMTEEPATLPDGSGRKDKRQVVLPDVVFQSLCRINPHIPDLAAQRDLLLPRLMSGKLEV